MDNKIFSRASNETDRVSDCVFGTKISAQPMQMLRRQAMTRVIAVYPTGIVVSLPTSSIPGMTVESLRTGRQKCKKNQARAQKNDGLWQMTYDNGFLINSENNKKIMSRSHQPIKKGKLYPRSTGGNREFMVSIA